MSNVVFHYQPETSVYVSHAGHIVISQRDEIDGDEGHSIIISPENIKPLISALLKVAKSEGR